MRARFLPLDGNSNGEIIRVDSFPAVVSLDEGGSVCINGRAQCVPLCLLDENAGNLIIKDQAESDAVSVNELPIAFGPLMPGDTLRLGSRRFVVSYERVTSTPPPSPTFRLAE